jgi:hypothetical protein
MGGPGGLQPPPPELFQKNLKMILNICYISVVLNAYLLSNGKYEYNHVHMVCNIIFIFLIFFFLF